MLNAGNDDCWSLWWSNVPSEEAAGMTGRAEGEFDGFLLGDRGYPCQPMLLTQAPNRTSLAHCRTRARVEMTIGLLKARFQCLRHLRVTPERACDIIVACILHNITTIRRATPCPTNGRH
ncbi:hemoglobin subunit alpha-D-like isoform X2 [Epinephelus fuscoguttatus]|uniref:hemoglobin subunit alpha-D-like isoform X2 n=1 Tax=Epinephelus fuscoguttatus TaxID=293821 RepID=UPI0020D028DC|nr:hemoglobin subunit alpha-D-like isoform X2 [Epinephelus fuscoguttatus]